MWACYNSIFVYIFWADRKCQFIHSQYLLRDHTCFNAMLNWFTICINWIAVGIKFEIVICIVHFGCFDVLFGSYLAECFKCANDWLFVVFDTVVRSNFLRLIDRMHNASCSIYIQFIRTRIRSTNTYVAVGVDVHRRSKSF